MSNKWVKIGETAKIIGVHPRILYVWENKGLIETKNRRRNVYISKMNRLGKYKEK